MAAINDEDIIEYKNEADHIIIWEEETNFTSCENSEINVKSELDDKTIDYYTKDEANVKETVENVNNIGIKKETFESINNIEIPEEDNGDVIEYKNEADHIWEEETNFTSCENSEINIKSELDDETIDYNTKDEAYFEETVENVNNIGINKETFESVNNIEFPEEDGGDVIEYKNEADHIWEEDTNFTSYDNSEINVKSEVDDKPIDYNIKDEANLKETVDNVSNIEDLEKRLKNVNGIEFTEKTIKNHNNIEFIFNLSGDSADELQIPDLQSSHHCARCPLSFDSLEAFDDHKWYKKHFGSINLCTVCKKHFSRSYDLKLHMRIHTGEKPYSCTVCKNYFGQSVHLSTHTLEAFDDHKIWCYKHFGSINLCTVCNKHFSSRYELKLHMRIHTGEKPYSCTVCKKQFSLKNNLISHMRIHTGEKPYSCTVCKNYFGQSVHLSAHMLEAFDNQKIWCNNHLGWIHLCAVCKKHFSRSYDLKLHMRIHTGEKPYSCTVCKKKFRQSGRLSRHMRTHTGEKQYSCRVGHSIREKNNYV